MATDLNAESEALTLADAARTLPGRPNTSTLFRWQTRGVRGIRLETMLVGGRRFVTRAALDRFFEALNPPQGGDEASALVPSQPSGPSGGKRSSETSQRLKEAGLAS